MSQTTEPAMLVKYRDAGMNTYTYFWKNSNNQTISPFFNSESEAQDWMELKNYQIEAHALWSDSCTTPRKT